MYRDFVYRNPPVIALMSKTEALASVLTKPPPPTAPTF